MQRHVFPVLLMSTIAIVSAQAEPLSLTPHRYTEDRYAQAAPPAPSYVVPQAAAAPIAAEREPARYASTNSERNLGGGFIEFLFSGGRAVATPRPPSEMLARGEPAEQAEIVADPRAIDPKFLKQVVPYAGSEPPGTIVIDTPQRFLFLVQDNGTAVRYGIGVGKPGFAWAGEKKVPPKGMA
jgi:lipoprotein-anchoring transpeptidase ErfK/SrfK